LFKTAVPAWAPPVAALTYLYSRVLLTRDKHFSYLPQIVTVGDA